MSKIIKPKILSTKEVYKFYCKQKKLNGEKVLPYWMFKEVVSRIAKKASDLIIQGGIFNLGNHLGYIKIRKIFRSFKKSVVNWGESNQLKREILERGGTPKSKDALDGEDWLIYYTNPWYLRWAWIRRGGASIFKNQTVYEFKPTSDSSKEADRPELGTDELTDNGMASKETR